MYLTLFVLFCQSFFCLTNIYIFNNYKKNKDIKLKLNYFSIFHSFILLLFLFIEYFYNNLPNYKNNYFTIFGYYIFYFTTIYYIINIPNCIKLHNKIYFVHHLFIIATLTIMFLTNNYYMFIQTVFILETTEIIINLRKLIINKLFKTFLLLSYLFIRGIIGFYFSYNYIQFIYTNYYYSFYIFIDCINFIALNIALFISVYWVFTILYKILNKITKNIFIY